MLISFILIRTIVDLNIFTEELFLEKEINFWCE